MLIEFEVAEGDLRLLRAHVVAARPMRVLHRRIYSSVLLLGLFPVALIAALLVSGHAPVEAYLFLLFVATALTVVWTIVFRIVLLPTMERAFVGSHAKLLGRHRFEVSEVGVRDRVTHRDTLYSWSALSAVHREPDHVFLLVEGTEYLVVPLRAFPDEGAIDAWTGLMEELRMAGRQPAVEQGDAL